jgi:hypothetical protein
MCPLPPAIELFGHRPILTSEHLLVTLQTVISSAVSYYTLHLMPMCKTRKWHVLCLYTELSVYISSQGHLTVSGKVYIIFVCEIQNLQ